MLSFPLFFGITTIDDNQVASSVGYMKLATKNLLISYLTIAA
jgi:hypothetical protein